MLLVIAIVSGVAFCGLAFGDRYAGPETYAAAVTCAVSFIWWVVGRARRW